MRSGDALIILLMLGLGVMVFVIITEIGRLILSTLGAL